ncbi:beta-ketoacyl-ACP synthase III [Novipirellula artificiosorum]|uniref:Beta-ketoacyl-[acyl-carrier-protein] synthase III n=1 Tax=Novipirellula artificiosorum TaxID=2528016 RepID=A0A5C6DN79_9BACT|nr:beta-ketoacyl-ACP synthase III [Novipirellula artificiosorum]TWU37111.1 3-oxoacyl-[acyl-carrier-protein] synthase 3 [Novipirellula artificiosorum]
MPDSNPLQSQSPLVTSPAPRKKAELATRGRMGSISGVQVTGIGTYVPENIVTNEDLAALGCDSEWIVRRTGIRERRHAAKDQVTSDMCYFAAKRCLESAGRSAADVDLVIVATMTPDYPSPSTACYLQNRLGAIAPAMDISAACAGFMYGMLTAGQFVSSGNSQCALVVGADLMSRSVDPTDVKTFPLFGDGAGAVILSPTPQGESSEVISYQLCSEGSGADMLRIAAGGTRRPLTPEAYLAGEQYMSMDGRGVFKWAVRVIDESIEQVLADAGVAAEEIKLVVMHQANERIIDSAVAGLKLPSEKVLMNLDRYGNTSAASIPLVLDEAMQAGRIERGDLVLLCGFGAGLSWGTALVRW